MIIKKTIKAKIIGLTKTKEDLINQEYQNFQLTLKGKNVPLYSATKQQALKYRKKFKKNRISFNHKKRCV